MVDKAWLRSIVLTILCQATKSDSIRRIASGRYEANGRPDTHINPSHRADTLSRRIHAVRVELESTPFRYDQVMSLLASLQGVGDAESEVHYLNACAYIRLAGCKGAGTIVEGAGGAPQDLPSAALQELRLALQADPHNFQCRELMDRAVSISGFEKIALELGRPS